MSFISGSSVTHGSKRQTVQIFSGAKNVSLRWVTWFYNFFPGFSFTDSAVSLFLAVIVRQVLTQIPVNQMTALVRLYRCKFKYLSFVEWKCCILNSYRAELHMILFRAWWLSLCYNLGIHQSVKLLFSGIRDKWTITLFAAIKKVIVVINVTMIIFERTYCCSKILYTRMW